MTDNRPITAKLIGRNWRRLKLSKKISTVLNAPVFLSKYRRECLKDSFKSSIWSLQVKGKDRTFPVILKIFKNLDRSESIVELNMYRKAGEVLKDLMPRIYFIERHVSGKQWWVGMEYIRPVKGQVEFTPHYFKKIIPSLAKLHAHTYNERFTLHQQVFEGWLPLYESAQAEGERKETNGAISQLLDQAMTRPDLNELLSPHHTVIKHLLNKGPMYFPELLEGQSIVHSDLQTLNMGCHNIKQNEWKIKFIDWEGAKFAPCWFDMVNMIGIFFSYRKDWRSQEDEITRECVDLYAKHMNKNGVTFKEEPYKLYQKAFLQRILEKTLYLQLTWEINKIKKAVLLPVLVEKIRHLSKELKM